MKDTTTRPYKGYRFPPEIISYCLWLYFRFSLSYRDVEEIMAERGVVLTYETVRQWCLKFGQTYANELRRRRPPCGDKWHLDEVFLTINGKRSYLWRAVDQDGNVLDILVQSRRNKKAAKRFFRKLLQGLEYVPRVLITDKLASAAKRELLPGVEHRQHKRLGHPSGTLLSTDQATGANHATVQISRPCTTVSFCLWSHFRSCSPTTAPPECGRGSCDHARPIPGVERGNGSA